MEISPVKNTVFFDGLLAHASSINSKREFSGENFGEKQGIFSTFKTAVTAVMQLRLFLIRGKTVADSPNILNVFFPCGRQLLPQGFDVCLDQFIHVVGILIPDIAV